MGDNTDGGFRTTRGYQMADRDQGRISSAMEDYLEMIYRLCSADGYARVGKISELLQVKPSSASKMIFKLASMGYIKYDRYEIIQLTEAGRKRGRYLLERHETVAAFLRLIGCENALEEVELIEHPLSQSTVTKLKILLDFFSANPQAEEGFRLFRKDRVRRGERQPDRN